MNPHRRTVPPGTAKRLAALVVVLAVLIVALGWLRARLPGGTPAPGPVAGLAQLPPLATCDGPSTTPIRITSSLAVQCGQRFDDRTIHYAGEVVGDVLERDRGAWVQLNDDAYALDLGPLPRTGIQAGTNSGLAVWLPTDAGTTWTPGRHDRRGDVLAITGTFHHADPDDGGGTTIHAQSIATIAPATAPEPRAPSGTVIVLAATTLLAAATLRTRPIPTRRP
ncbi:hypothetical protein [Salsipaludibacter albus]|uniref:hypothetical protein n=1 Tax=Salsipaludibacter albus TaxID=2849650 RepID=UPI001EE4A5A8|nr:hypothetical protein [Salsipaludibacter albus]MBY5162662.1 hypothetical protein [Salsipaludibacter albus]